MTKIIPISLSVGDTFSLPIKTDPSERSSDIQCLVLNVYEDVYSTLYLRLVEFHSILLVRGGHYFDFSESNKLIDYIHWDKEVKLFQLLIGNRKVFLSCHQRSQYNAWASTTPQSE